MKTAVYLSNRTPHAALQDGTPYKALYGKDAYLGHLRVIGSWAFVHEEVHTNKLKHRAWEGRLVGFSEESKSYRIYISETQRVRVNQNVIFIQTPSVAPSLDARGFDDGEFTYDDHDDMLRDVQNYTSNHSVDSLSPERAVGDAVGDPSAIGLLEQICETTNRDLGLAPAGSTPSNDAPGTAGGTPEEDIPAPPGGVSPPVPVNDAYSPGSSPGPAPPLGSSPTGSAPPGTAPQGILCVDAVRLVVDEVPRRRLQSPGLLRAVDLHGEASRSAVDVAAGLHVDVVLVVDEVPRRRLQPPGLLRAYPLQRPSASFVASPTRLP